MAITDEKRLRFLHDLDELQIAHEQPDVRGWNLVDKRGEVIGTVENILVDVQKEKVRYLDIALDESIIGKNYEPQDNQNIEGFINQEGENNLLVPIGLARLDAEEQRVVVDNVAKNAFHRTPRYNTEAPIGADYEFAVSQALVSPQAGMNKYDRPVGTATPDEFYENDLFNEERFYKKKTD